MNDYESIRQMFPTGTFWPPCTREEIAEAEQLLGYPLPDQIRELYYHFNGFDVPGWMATFFPLHPKHAGTSSAVSMSIGLKKDCIEDSKL